MFQLQKCFVFFTSQRDDLKWLFSQKMIWPQILPQKFAFLASLVNFANKESKQGMLTRVRLASGYTVKS